MNTLAERVRAAAAATAQEVTPDSIRDWQELAIRSTARRERDARTRRWRVRARWLAPLTAAVAVLAVVVASAMVGADHAGSPSRSQEPAAFGSGALPRYYALIVSVDGTCRLVIHDARSGATLAAVRLAGQGPGDFQLVAAASDTTFAIGHRGQTGVMSYVVAHFDPARKAIAVRKLPFATLPLRESASTIALSPDGTELAVAVQISSDRELRLTELRVYSLATGAVKVWTASAGYPTFIQDLSWGATGVLGFDLMNTGRTDATQAGIRLLNPNVAAGSLLAASTLAVPQTQPAGFQVGGSFTIIDDGAAVVTVVGRTASPGRKVVSQFEVLSTRTGRVIRAFLPSTRPDAENSQQGLVWANSAGTVLAGFVPYAGTHPSSIGPLEWISGSRYAPVRGLPRHAPFPIAL